MAALIVILRQHHIACQVAEIEYDYFRERYDSTPWWRFRRRRDLTRKMKEQWSRVWKLRKQFRQAMWNKDDT